MCCCFVFILIQVFRYTSGHWLTFSADRDQLFYLTHQHSHISWANDPRANIYSPLTLNFASILANCCLVRSAIIQTGNANVNELRFAYLYFATVEMSLVMTLHKEECHSWWPPDMLLAIKKLTKEEKKRNPRGGGGKTNKESWSKLNEELHMQTHRNTCTAWLLNSVIKIWILHRCEKIIRNWKGNQK